MNEQPTPFQVWTKLLWMFLKVNLLSPSGPASIGLLFDEAVGTLMSEERFVEAVGLSNVLPGSEALKLAMFVSLDNTGSTKILAGTLLSDESVDTFAGWRFASVTPSACHRASSSRTATQP